MMEVVVPLSFREQFERAARESREEILWRERMARFDAKDRERRVEKLTQEKREEERRAAFAQVFASLERIDAFTYKLDRYDTVTVETLMENRIALDKVRDQLETLLTDAHTLPDGRRVFKTRDGTKVFDEQGTELKPDAVDPNQIDANRPSWEDYREARDRKLALEKERGELLEFQDRSDAARDGIRRERVTTKDVDDLEADLDKAMPEAIRRKLARDRQGPTADASVERETKTDDLHQKAEPIQRQSAAALPGPT